METDDPLFYDPKREQPKEEEKEDLCCFGDDQKKFSHRNWILSLQSHGASHV